ncbi:MAG: hypothetical protein AMQ74_01766 [Candidatus Methanofastidiosum methylothiophilum]|uniref:Uncharacterized protein n=1 Tax=Candidatus Methanofastidiosum methylothiophilum TaxID=1705564 RepID=A0A150IPD2_9EURY|nr:MAG: hypothetical protein AMQ74_01766 [Candidatus Methanofastidiosum methylthiophilus]
MLLEAITQRESAGRILEHIATYSSDISLLEDIAYMFPLVVWNKKCISKGALLGMIEETEQLEDLVRIFEDSEDLEICNAILERTTNPNIATRNPDIWNNKIIKLILQGNKNTFLDKLNGNEELTRAYKITKEAINGEINQKIPPEELECLAKNPKVPEKVLEEMLEKEWRIVVGPISTRKDLSESLSLKILRSETSIINKITEGKVNIGNYVNLNDSVVPVQSLAWNTPHPKVIEEIIKFSRTTKLEGKGIINSLLFYNETLREELPELFKKAFEANYGPLFEIYVPGHILEEWYGNNLHPKAMSWVYQRLHEDSKQKVYSLVSMEVQALLSIKES